MPSPVWSASIQWLCEHVGVLRLHVGPDGIVGSPYVWCCTVDRDGDVATLCGVCRAVPPGAASVVVKALRDAGITQRRHERRGIDKVRVVTKRIDS